MRESTPFKLATALGILGMIWMFAGCATLNNPVTTQRIVAISKLATYSSCVATAGEPGSVARTKWLSALGELNYMIEQRDWRPVLLGAALAKAGVPEMIGTEGKLVISGGVVLVDLFTSILWPVDTAKFVEAVATGARDGIDLALNDALSERNMAGFRYERASLIQAQLRMEAEATRPRKN